MVLSGIIAAIILSTALAVRLLSKKFSLFGKWAKNISLRNTLHDENHARLLSYYLEATGNMKHRILTLYESFLADKFFETLREKVGENAIEVCSESCDLGRERCNTIIKITGKNGNLILATLNWAEADIKDAKGRKSYTSEFVNIEDYDLGEGVFAYSSGIDIVYSNTIDENNDDVLDVVEAMQSAMIKRITYEKGSINTRISKLIRTSVGAYTVRPSNRQVEVQDETYLDLAYNKVKLSYGGVEKELSMSRGLHYAEKALSGAENLYIWGKPGSGKTKLLEQIARIMAERTDVHCLELTPGIIKELQTAEGGAALEAELRQFADQGIKTIIFIDDAENSMAKGKDGLHTEDNTILLQMLAGNLQKDLNCNCVLSFNARPENLNEKLFRPGRIGSMTIELNELPLQQANELVKYLQSKFSDKVFDAEGYHNRVTNITKLITGAMYTPAGMIMLSEVYDCFMDRDQRALLMDEFRAEAGLPPLTENKRKVVVPEATPEADPKGKAVSINEKYAEKKAVVNGRKQLADNAPATTEAEPSTPTPTIAAHKKRNRGKRKKNK